MRSSAENSKVPGEVKLVKIIQWTMSAEAERAEEKKEERPTRQSAVAFARENWTTGFRMVELVFAIFCIGLVVDPLNYAKIPQLSIHHVAMVFSAFSGYIIINSVIILGRLAGEQLGWKTSVAFSLIGAIVFSAAGGVIIYDWTKYMYNHIFHPSKQYMDMMISSGVLSVFTAFIFVLDAIFTYREEP